MMSNTRFFLLLFMAAIQLPVLKGQSGTISGTVIDAITGNPVAGHAVVYFGTTYGQNTDEKGYFEISGLKTEDCEIIIDGGQEYCTLSLRNLPLSKKRTTIALDSIYLSPITLGYDIVKLPCIQFENENYPYTATSGIERFISGELGVVNFNRPYDTCPELTITENEKPGTSPFNRFPGGRDGLQKYVAKNAFYPEKAMQNKQVGFSFSSITITPYGTIENIKIHNSINYALDNSVFEILKATDGLWAPDKKCTENQTVYIQIVFDYKTNDKFDPTTLDGEDILKEVFVLLVNSVPLKYKSTKSLEKRVQKSINKGKFISAIDDLKTCILRDPFNLEHRKLLALCFEAAEETDLKAEVEAQIQSIESKNFSSLFSTPKVFGNIKIFKELKNGTFSITELLRDSTLLYSGKLKSINPEIKHGKFYFYNDLGKLSSNGQYEDDIPVGIWTYYNENQEAVFATNYTKVLNFILQEDTAEYNKDPFFIVEDMPKFNGGDPAVEFRKYILENIIYPEYPKIKGIEGNLIVQFMVDYTGRVRMPKIVRGLYPDLNVEALRVILESPLWTPGKQLNTPTDVLFTFPINFSSNGDVLALMPNEGNFERITSDDKGRKFEFSSKWKYAELDSPPMFQGKDAGNFGTHVLKTLRYPETAAENEIKGRVVVQFAVNSDGSIGDITLVESSHPDLNSEAIRVVKASPKWEPAKMNGAKVVCYLRACENFCVNG